MAKEYLNHARKYPIRQSKLPSVRSLPTLINMRGDVQSRKSIYNRGLEYKKRSKCIICGSPRIQGWILNRYPKKQKFPICGLKCLNSAIKKIDGKLMYYFLDLNK